MLEEVDVLIDAHSFNEFRETKSSLFLKKVIENQNVIDMRLRKMIWRKLHKALKTMTGIMGSRRNSSALAGEESRPQRRMRLSAFAASRDCLSMQSTSRAAAENVSGEINTRNEIVVNIMSNNILIQRGLIAHEQKWEDRKMVKTARDEITI